MSAAFPLQDVFELPLIFSICTNGLTFLGGALSADFFGVATGILLPRERGGAISSLFSGTSSVIFLVLVVDPPALAVLDAFLALVDLVVIVILFVSDFFAVALDDFFAVDAAVGAVADFGSFAFFCSATAGAVFFFSDSGAGSSTALFLPRRGGSFNPFFAGDGGLSVFFARARVTAGMLDW